MSIPCVSPIAFQTKKSHPKRKKDKKKVFLYLHSSNLSLGSNKAPSLLLFSIDSFHSLEFSQLETRQTWHRALETARLSHVCDGHHPRALFSDTSLPKETTVFSTTFLCSPTFDCFQIGPTALHYLDTHTEINGGKKHQQLLLLLFAFRLKKWWGAKKLFDFLDTQL